MADGAGNRNETAVGVPYAAFEKEGDERVVLRRVKVEPAAVGAFIWNVEESLRVERRAVKARDCAQGRGGGHVAPFGDVDVEASVAPAKGDPWRIGRDRAGGV